MPISVNTGGRIGVMLIQTLETRGGWLRALSVVVTISQVSTLIAHLA